MPPLPEWLAPLSYGSRWRSNVSVSALNTDDADVDADAADAADAADSADAPDAPDPPDAPDSPDAAQDETWPTWWTLQAKVTVWNQQELGSLLGKAAFSPTEMGYDGFELVKLVKGICYRTCGNMKHFCFISFVLRNTIVDPQEYRVW